MNEEEIRFIDLIKIFLKKKFFILISTISFTLLFIILSYAFPNFYKSQATIKVINQSQTLDSSISMLAPFAGINFGSDTKTRTSQDIFETITSDYFISNFLSEYDYVKAIIAAKGETQDGTLNFDENIVSSEYNWSQDLQKENIPTSLDAAKKFKEDYFSSSIGDDGYIVLSVDFFNKDMTYALLDNFLNYSNEYFRELDSSDYQEAINFAQEEKSNLLYKDLEKLLNEVIEQNLNLLILSKTKKQYAFEILDKHLKPEKRFFPRRSLFAIYGFFLGIGFALIFILTKEFLQNNPLIGERRKD
tara:strand:- start:6428 stop:7336 length:909 start_codon:yes stop_codon:yes gene_type:complete